MQIELLPQIEIGGIKRKRIGDYLNSTIASEHNNKFQFAVAYMRLSGLDRIAGAIDSLINRGGVVSGIVGVDDEITSSEALDALLRFSSTSAVFHTISGFIYHPKLYMINGEKSATAYIGSANLTLNGLFRNIEVMTEISLDFEQSEDYEVYQNYKNFIGEMLNTSNPNIQPITPESIEQFIQSGLVKRESDGKEPGPTTSNRGNKSNPELDLRWELFPPFEVPIAPPGFGLIRPKVKRKSNERLSQTPIIVPPTTVGNISTFIMQLSAFDSSHRTGRPGTPEVLIPLAAQTFFPDISITGRKYPDANFDVVLNTPFGQERHSYRVWFYDVKDEFRLRMNHTTIDLSYANGGDLIVINKLSEGSDPQYEVTILPRSDPTYASFIRKCTKESQGKKWGIVETI